MMKKQDFDDLAQRIHDAQQKCNESTNQSNHSHGRHMAIGMRIMIEMIICPAMGGLLGWVIDQWLSTQPWATIIFVILGSIAGIMQARRASIQHEKGYHSAL